MAPFDINENEVAEMTSRCFPRQKPGYEDWSDTSFEAAQA